MQRVPTSTSEQRIHPNSSPTPSSSSHHGIQLPRGSSDGSRPRSDASRGSSPRSVCNVRGESPDGVNAGQLDERLRGLSLGRRNSSVAPAAGKRISDYENALTPPTPRQALGFKVIKRSDSRLDGTQLLDFPNEILTHVLSHLHPDSHAAVALVNKRFYGLVTTPHAWRMAFLRYFPGHAILEHKAEAKKVDVWSDLATENVRSETRYFGRLTALATWRSEYLFRTRLMRSLTRGKPGTNSGGIGSSSRTSQSSKKVSAVLTYNSKLPWLVTSVHAVFTNGKKPPRAIQGTGDLGVATVSDPTTGKIEKWGLEDAFTTAQLDEIVPNLVPYGLGEGLTAVPNVIDVSQPYGMISGEGFPGGRAFFRGASEMRGRYVGSETGVVASPDIPNIPEMSEAISSVWIAKSSAVPASTQSMIGMLTGSTLGVLTAYSLGWDPAGPRYSNGDITARWVLSPGVPIVAVKVDENYSVKRKTSARVWAVALNALGEVYYLTETPEPMRSDAKADDVVKNAWYAGRSVYWHLLEGTRRVARPDDFDKNAIRGAYTPRSPSNHMKLSKDQLAAEAREIEKFLRHKPSHFRKVCEGWDMQRRLEVDFASDDGQGAGESIFVLDCGLVDSQPAQVCRYSRANISQAKATSETTPAETVPASIFGTQAEPVVKLETPEKQSPRSPPSTPMPLSGDAGPLHDWDCVTLDFKGRSNVIISASALDCSSHAQLTLTEDPLRLIGETAQLNAATRSEHNGAEIPGRRARLLAIGTKSGSVLVWNAREDKSQAMQPLRVIQTESPEISSLALTALYLVHGGSDGLVQAWDPLASTLDPVRTLNARSNGRVPRHMMTMNPALREGNYSRAGAIFLDPDPTVLRGVVAFGAFMRYWAYSSTGHPTGRKRRLRHSDIHGRTVTRRLGGAVAGYIAAEEAELRRENEQRAREATRLRKRFGLGALGDLTEEEQLRYAEIVSEEAFMLDEHRRASDSAADASLDTASSLSETTTVDTVTPEPSVNGFSSPPPPAPATLTTDDESEYEQQIQQAIRLSLLEGVNDLGQSPRGNSSGDYEFPITYKPKSSGKRACRSQSTSPTSSVHTPVIQAGPSVPVPDADEDLALALSLSMQEEDEAAAARTRREEGSVSGEDQFPPLDTQGVGKGKGVRRY